MKFVIRGEKRDPQPTEVWLQKIGDKILLRATAEDGNAYANVLIIDHMGRIHLSENVTGTNFETDHAGRVVVVK